jgi:hypothetical protein
LNFNGIGRVFENEFKMKECYEIFWQSIWLCLQVLYKGGKGERSQRMAQTENAISQKRFNQFSLSEYKRLALI